VSDMGNVCEIRSVKEDFEALEAYTNHLPPFTALISPEALPQTGWVEYELGGGKGRGYNLLNIGIVAVQRVEIPRGTTFPQHGHQTKDGKPVVEYGIIYEGRMKVTNFTTGEESILEPKDCVRLGEGESHKGEALTDVCLINITVPAAEGYPENGHVKERLNARASKPPGEV